MGVDSSKATPPASELLEVSDLVVERPGMRIRVAGLRVAAGDALAILGPSGSGKSSLLAALLDHRREGEVLGISGRIRFAGEPRPTRGSPAWRSWLRGPVVAVLQDARAAFDPLRPLGDQIAELAGRFSDPAVRVTEARGEILTAGDSLRFTFEHAALPGTRLEGGGAVRWPRDTVLFDFALAADTVALADLRFVSPDFPDWQGKGRVGVQCVFFFL